MEFAPIFAGKQIPCPLCGKWTVAEFSKPTPSLLKCMRQPAEIKIACPSCGGHIEFPPDMAGQIINCPHCSLSVALQIPGYTPPQPIAPLPTAPQAAARKIAGDNEGLAFVLALVGIILCGAAIFTCWTALPGLILLAIGSSQSQSRKCSECGSKVSMSAKFCPACKSTFPAEHAQMVQLIRALVIIVVGVAVIAFVTWLVSH